MVTSRLAGSEVREMKGKAIFELGNQVTRIDDFSYQVGSQSGYGVYDIRSTELGWLCSCLDHIYRGVKCKHVFAVEFSQAIRQEVQGSIIIDQTSCVIAILAKEPVFWLACLTSITR